MVSKSMNAAHEVSTWCSQTNTNTYFNREPETFRMIRDRLMIPRKQTGQSVSIWSVGCATGDEPYTIAIDACELASRNIDILATDIRADGLAQAIRGRYPARNIRHLDNSCRDRWFRKKADEFVLDDAIKKLVRFRRHDVMRDPPLAPSTANRATHGQWDVILCRNLFIYYQREAVRRALDSLVRVIKPDGLLIVGGGEWLTATLRGPLPSGESLALTQFDGVLVYRKQDKDSASPLRLTEPVYPKNERSTSGVYRRSGDRAADRSSLIRTEHPDSRKPRDESVAARSNGDRLLDSGEPESALCFYLTALRQNPLAHEIHLRVGICHLFLGQVSRAYDALRRSLFLEPKLWLAAWLLGDLLRDNHPDTAIRYFTQAKRILEETSDEPFEANAVEQEIGLFAPNRRVALEAIEARIRNSNGRK